MARMKGIQSTAYDLGKFKVRVTTQRRWWQVTRATIGVEVWVHDPSHFAYGYYTWKPTK